MNAGKRDSRGLLKLNLSFTGLRPGHLTTLQEIKFENKAVLLHIDLENRFGSVGCSFMQAQEKALPDTSIFLIFLKNINDLPDHRAIFS